MHIREQFDGFFRVFFNTIFFISLINIWLDIGQIDPYRITGFWKFLIVELADEFVAILVGNPVSGLQFHQNFLIKSINEHNINGNKVV